MSFLMENFISVVLPFFLKNIYNSESCLSFNANGYSNEMIINQKVKYLFEEIHERSMTKVPMAVTVHFIDRV